MGGQGLFEKVTQEKTKIKQGRFPATTEYIMPEHFHWPTGKAARIPQKRGSFCWKGQKRKQAENRVKRLGI